MTDAWQFDWEVAADHLEEAGFSGHIVESMREMRRRLLALFRESEEMALDTSDPCVIDGWEYHTDARVLIRVRTSAEDTQSTLTRKISGMLKREKQVVHGWEHTGDWWRDWPSPGKVKSGEEWNAYQVISGRHFAWRFVKLISRLPMVEYLEDSEDYVPKPGSPGTDGMTHPPLVFRFAFGQGVVMPLKPDRDMRHEVEV